jgi:hypothetical protein
MNVMSMPALVTEAVSVSSCSIVVETSKEFMVKLRSGTSRRVATDL